MFVSVGIVTAFYTTSYYYYNNFYYYCYLFVKKKRNERGLHIIVKQFVINLHGRTGDIKNEIKVNQTKKNK